ncbi:MAG: hypothetical protein QUT30_12170 [Acidobacteriota bacterium]|nr:hypothetical protein [Acidobacteriota bacterium]
MVGAPSNSPGSRARSNPALKTPSVRQWPCAWMIPPILCRFPATQALKVRSSVAQAEGCEASEGLQFRTHLAQALLRNSWERGRLGRKKAGGTPALP